MTVRPRAAILSVLTCLSLVGVGTVATTVPAQAEPVNSCGPSENGDPVLKSVDLAAGTYDVTRGSADVRITVKAVDSGRPGWATGVRSVEVGLSNGVISRLRYTGSSTWAGTATIPRWSQEGTVEVSYVGLEDRADWPKRGFPEDEDRFDVTYRVTGPDTFADVTGNRSVTVVSEPDTTRPRVTDFDLYPAVVDTRRRARTVTVTARAFDGGSGVDHGEVTFDRPSGLNDRVVRLRPLPGRHGLMSGTLRVPTGSGTGPWPVWSLRVYDRAGQVRALDATGLTAQDHPGRLWVWSDAVAPAGRAWIRSFTASTASVDVRDRSRAVDYRLRVTNGPGRVRDVVLSLPADAGVHLTQPRLVSGDRHDGIWTSEMVVDRCLATTGTLTPVARAYDRLRRHVRTGPRLAVTAGDTTNPRLTSAALTTEISVGFSERVDGITRESMPVTTLPGGEVVTGQWTCAPAPAGDCSVGPVRSAVFTPDVPLSGQTYLVSVNPEHSLGVTDLAGNPVYPVVRVVTAP